MRHSGNRQRKTAALLLAACLLAGCGQAEEVSTSVVAGETISADSKWINSEIDGAVNEETQVSLKDDFYTAVNLEWLLETELTEEEPSADCFTEIENLIRERKLDLIQSQEIPEENQVGMDPDLIAHDAGLVREFAQLAGDWEKRNELGTEPLRPFVEAIEQIQNQNDMTSYLVNEDGRNFAQLTFLGLTAGVPYSGTSEYAVILAPNQEFTLGSQDEYLSLSENGNLKKIITDEKVSWLLGRMGYDDARIRRILQLCYRFEDHMAGIMKTTDQQGSIKYLKRSDNHFSYEELRKLCRNYPLEELLKSRHIENRNQYIVLEPDYIKGLDRLYRESNLEEMKAYCLVHTVCEIMPLLDRESFEKAEEWKQLLKAGENKQTSPTGQNPKSEEDREQDELDILFDNFIRDYMSGPMEQLYVAGYCSQEMKDEVLSLVDEVISYYRVLLREKEWLSEETREKAVEKLNRITVRAVYPEQFTDYRTLVFASEEEGGTLVDAVAEVRSFRVEQDLKKVGTAADYQNWDLDEAPTTEVNAYYNVLENSVTIQAGILNGAFYDPDASEEEKLAGIGAVIGHEITHAFDSNGFQFDQNGKKDTWCTSADMSNFMFRANDVGAYYGAISPYPGAALYNGSNVEAEAIADMGGVKCALSVGKKSPEFDLQKFFKAYAGVWRTKRSFAEEKSCAGDEHPLEFLRTNVTLQQFEEFYEAFDIRPGDGMYLAPEKRVPVW